MQRQKYIDLLKIISAYIIVLSHMNISSLHAAMGQISNTQYTFAYTAYQFVYVFVAVFILLTGCGLLSTERNSYKEMWPRILKMIVLILFWGLCFEGANVLIRHEELSLIKLVTDLYNGTTWSHMWFLNKLVGLYLIVPILGAFVNKSNRHSQILFASLCFVFGSIVPFITRVAGITLTNIFPIDGMFIAYAMAGYLIGTMPKDKCKKYAVLYLLGTIIGAILVILYALSEKDMIVQIDNPFTALMAISLVLFVKAITVNGNESKRIEMLSRCTLGVYIIHPIFIHIASSILHINPQLHLPLLFVPIEALGIFIISMIIVWIYRRIISSIFPLK